MPERLALTCVSLVCLLSSLAQAADLVDTSAIGKPELGFLEKIWKEVGGRPDHWVEKFCALALSQKGEDYASLVRFARRESIALSIEERRSRPAQESYGIGRYVSYDENRRRFFLCLEHGGESASADVQYELYWLGRGTLSGRPDYWVMKAAHGGVVDAQIEFAKLVLEFLVRGIYRETPHEVREEIKPERFHYWLKRAADSGSTRGAYELATLHRNGYSSQPWATPYIDIPLAIKLLEKVAQDTHEAAMKARSEFPSQYAFPELIPGHESLRSHAAAHLGEIYFQGKGVPQDHGLALKWFREVDEKYFLHCRASLAWVFQRMVRSYMDGLGTKKDPEKVAYYQRFAGTCH